MCPSGELFMRSQEGYFGVLRSNERKVHQHNTPVMA